MHVFYLGVFFGEISSGISFISSFGAWRIYMISIWSVSKYQKPTHRREKHIGTLNNKTWNKIYEHPSKTKYKKTRKITCSHRVRFLLSVSLPSNGSTSKSMCHFHIPHSTKQKRHGPGATKWHWRALRRSSGVIASVVMLDHLIGSSSCWWLKSLKSPRPTTWDGAKPL